MIDKDRAQLALTFISILTHPDIEIVRRVTTDDFVWSFPGNSRISREAQGADGVMQRAQTIAAYQVKVEVIGSVFGLASIGVILHNTGNKNGRVLNEDVVAFFHFRDNKLVRLDTHLSDVAMAEAFLGSENAIEEEALA